MDHFTLHQLRHLAASIVKKEGAITAELQRTTEIYAGHLDNDTKTQNELLGKVWYKKLSGDGDESCLHQFI